MIFFIQLAYRLFLACQMLVNTTCLLPHVVVINLNVFKGTCHEVPTLVRVEEVYHRH